MTELTATTAEVVEEIPEAVTPAEKAETLETAEKAETVEKATLPEETTKTTAIAETQESVTLKVRAMVEEAIAQILDVVNGVISFVKNINIDVKLPSLGGESQAPTPPAVD